ncbi:MAG: hypothetical protein H6Q01_886, partial [Acidobacteria bacterium]|nr:hypothetical protein [Acidobacteriota bacterium]
NMLIGVSSGISFNRFLVELAPVALVGLGVAWGVLVLTYRDEFRKGDRLRAADRGSAPSPGSSSARSAPS